MDDYSIQVYDGGMKKCIANLDESKGLCNGHKNRISSIKFDMKNENVMYSASWDRNIMVWDIRQKNSITSFLCGTIYYDGALDVSGNYLFTGCCPVINTDPLIQTYDIRKYRCVNTIKQREFIRDNEQNESSWAIYNIKCENHNEF
eukprot:UN27025